MKEISAEEFRLLVPFVQLANNYLSHRCSGGKTEYLIKRAGQDIVAAETYVLRDGMRLWKADHKVYKLFFNRPFYDV